MWQAGAWRESGLDPTVLKPPWQWLIRDWHGQKPCMENTGSDNATAQMLASFLAHHLIIMMWWGETRASLKSWTREEGTA